MANNTFEDRLRAADGFFRTAFEQASQCSSPAQSWETAPQAEEYAIVALAAAGKIYRWIRDRERQPKGKERLEQLQYGGCLWWGSSSVDLAASALQAYLAGERTDPDSYALENISRTCKVAMSLPDLSDKLDRD